MGRMKALRRFLRRQINSISRGRLYLHLFPENERRPVYAAAAGFWASIFVLRGKKKRSGIDGISHQSVPPESVASGRRTAAVSGVGRNERPEGQQRRYWAEKIIITRVSRFRPYKYRSRLSLQKLYFYFSEKDFFCLRLNFGESILWDPLLRVYPSLRWLIGDNCQIPDLKINK